MPEMSRSYPFLWLARRFNVNYGDVLRLADMYDRMPLDRLNQCVPDSKVAEFVLLERERRILVQTQIAQTHDACNYPDCDCPIEWAGDGPLPAAACPGVVAVSSFPS